ncbi:hypothetical protein T484DRAFT_1769633, partial [Baffinella frigidus]
VEALRKQCAELRKKGTADAEVQEWLVKERDQLAGARAEVDKHQQENKEALQDAKDHLEASTAALTAMQEQRREAEERVLAHRTALADARAGKEEAVREIAEGREELARLREQEENAEIKPLGRGRVAAVPLLLLLLINGHDIRVEGQLAHELSGQLTSVSRANGTYVRVEGQLTDAFGQGLAEELNGTRRKLEEARGAVADKEREHAMVLKDLGFAESERSRQEVAQQAVLSGLEAKGKAEEDRLRELAGEVEKAARLRVQLQSQQAALTAEADTARREVEQAEGRAAATQARLEQ